MSELREQIMKELKDEAAKERAEIQELNEKISTQIYLKSTVRGGLLANAAIAACEKRENAARLQIKKVEAKNAWKQEMLSKYK